MGSWVLALGVGWGLGLKSRTSSLFFICALYHQGHEIYEFDELCYSKMSSSANTSRRRGILAILLHISKMVWHEHINKSISFHMQIRLLNSCLPF